MTTRRTVTAAILSALAFSTAASAALPSGQYMAPDGSGALVQADQHGWSITDPMVPAIQIRGDYQGGCMMHVGVEPVPCTSIVGPSSVSVSAPTIGFHLQLHAAAGVTPSGQQGLQSPATVTVAPRGVTPSSRTTPTTVVARGHAAVLDSVNATAFYQAAATCHQLMGEPFDVTAAEANLWLAQSFPTWDAEIQQDVAQTQAYWTASQQQPMVLAAVCDTIWGLIYGAPTAGGAAGHQGGGSSTELPAITTDGMGNMDGTVTISDGGMSYDY